MSRYWGQGMSHEHENQMRVAMEHVDAHQRADLAVRRLHSLEIEIAELLRQIADLHRENLALKVKLGIATDA